MSSGEADTFLMSAFTAWNGRITLLGRNPARDTMPMSDKHSLKSYKIGFRLCSGRKM